VAIVSGQRGCTNKIRLGIFRLRLRSLRGAEFTLLDWLVRLRRIKVPLTKPIIDKDIAKIKLVDIVISALVRKEKKRIEKEAVSDLRW